MRANRRQILAGSIACALTVPLPAWAQQSRVRRNIATMAPNDPDLRTLSAGIQLMRGRTDALSYEAQRAFHATHWYQHGTWRFLPWHRMQLAAFERIITALTGNPAFALPYWDWQQTPHLPAILFSDPGLAVAGRRATTATDVAAARWGMDSTGAQVLQDSFDDFAGSYEGAGRVESYGHNLVHVVVGGRMGAVETATLDPIFWLHHCNIDRVWTTWHDRAGQDYPTDFLSEELTGFTAPDGGTLSATPADLLETPNLGYVYDAYYPFPVFSMDLGLVRTGQVRKAVGATNWRVTGSAKEVGSAELALPDDLVAALRGDRDQVLDFAARGTLHFGYANLEGRVARLVATAPQGRASDGGKLAPVVLAAAPAFVHAPSANGMAHEDHAMGRVRAPDWAFRVKFGREIGNLVARSKGPVMLRVETVPRFFRRSPGPAPAVAGAELVLSLKRYAWQPASG